VLLEDETRTTSSYWLYGEGSVTRPVATSAGVEAELGKEKGGDDVSWDDMNLTGPKKNSRDPFSCYK
jgi:hypothetical protein